MSGWRGRRAAVATAAAVVLAGALAGCGTPPWADSPGTGTPTPTPSPTPTAVPQPVPNDLSGGSTERRLQAGAVAATVNYWSTLGMDRWTASALKPVSLSMVTAVSPDDGQQVYLQRATMIAVPGDQTQSFTPLPAQVDQASVTPGYLVLDPYSYSQTFTIGEVPSDATLVTLQFTFDFLVQTTPTSSEYAKQTASDSLTVAIAGAAAG